MENKIKHDRGPGATNIQMANDGLSSSLLQKGLTSANLQTVLRPAAASTPAASSAPASQPANQTTTTATKK